MFDFLIRCYYYGYPKGRIRKIRKMKFFTNENYKWIKSNKCYRFNSSSFLITTLKPFLMIESEDRISPV